MRIWELSANQVSAESNKTHGFTLQNYSKYKTCLDEEMQLEVPENIFLIQICIILTHDFWQFRVIKHLKKGREKRYGNRITFCKNTIVGWDLDGKYLESCFDETDFEYQNEL